MRLGLCLAGGFLGVLMLGTGFLLLLEDSVTYHLGNAVALLDIDNSDRLSAKDERVLVSLERRGLIVTEKSLVEHIVDFYTAIITILTVIISAILAVIFLYFRSKAGEEARDEAKKVSQDLKKELEVHIESFDFVEKASKSVREVVDSRMDDIYTTLDSIENLEDSGVSLSDLKSRVEVIEKYISENDDEDEEGSEDELDIDGGKA